MEVQCKTCRKIFEVTPFYFKRRKYCSPQCYWKSLKKSLSGEKKFLKEIITLVKFVFVRVVS